MRVYGFLAIVLGFLVAVSAYMIISFIIPEQAFLLALATGLLFGVILYPVLIILDHRRNKQYEKFEKTITSPVLYKSVGNFETAVGIKNGNIYFCRDGVLFVSFENKSPLVDQLTYDAIERWELTDTAHISVFLTDGRYYFIAVPNAADALKALERNELMRR